MNISTKLAQMIVTDMKQIINKEINYIDTNGNIIASTNLHRIGLFHGGGKKVVENKADLIIEYDGQYKGTRKGINMPIYFERSIVGVIGITGEREEVEKYGKIIKRMTEILIKEEYIENLKNKEKENHRMIIEEIITNADKNESALLEKVSVFKMNTDASRLVIIAEILQMNSNIMEKKDEIYTIFHRMMIKDSDNLIMQNRNSVVLMLTEISKSQLLYRMDEISKELKRKYGLQVKFGVGSLENSFVNLKISYEKAKLALDWVKLSPRESIRYYSEMDIELIISNVSEIIAYEFCDKVIGNLEEGDIEEYREILQLFEEFNGSIKKISEILFIHKNSLQYKLNRLRDKTGYDMRKYRDFVLLKVAFALKE